MLGIQVSGKFLTLAPGSQAQLKRNNPFLTADVIPGEYSLPISIAWTEENCRILGFVFQYYTKRQKTTVNAVLYDDSAVAYKGSLVLEGLESGNINSPQSATITGYFLCGATPFFANIKDVLLKDVLMGSTTHPWTSANPFDGSGGFWQHVHQTWYNNQWGYVFYPVRNEGWGGENGTIDFMNKMERNPNGFRLDPTGNHTSLCPHLYLVFVLRKIFEAYGYTLTGDVLQDADFNLLTLVTFRACNWANIQTGEPNTNVTINIADHCPPTKKITDLFLELQQYFAITFIIDPLTRMAELTALKLIRTQTDRKDWTQYADPKFSSDFSEEKKIYALQTEIDGGDSMPGSAIDTTYLDIIPAVQNHADLYALIYPYRFNAGAFCYCHRDNTWYQLQGAGWPFLDWIPMNYNIFNYEPTGYTDSFSSKISTLAMSWDVEKLNQAGVPDYYRLYPACNQEGTWPAKQGKEVSWEFRLLFYRGMAAEYTATVAIPGPTDFTAGAPYPYATHTTGDGLFQSIPIGSWALPYVYTNPGTNADAGSMQYWWRPWLNMLEAQPEKVTHVLNLPRHVMQNHKWTDIILIRHVPYLVESFDETIPYPGYVTAELRRVG